LVNPDHLDVDPKLAAKTAAAADVLADQLRRDGDAVAWANLEQRLEQYEEETGAPADELLPGYAAPLAFAGLDRAREYAHKVLCGRKEDLRVPIEAGINGGSVALVPVLFATLSLPVAAAPVVGVIAAVLMVRGLDGFCASADAPPT
jgi:hypothetical protein